MKKPSEIISERVNFVQGSQHGFYKSTEMLYIEHILEYLDDLVCPHHGEVCEHEFEAENEEGNSTAVAAHAKCRKCGYCP